MRWIVDRWRSLPVAVQNVGYNAVGQVAMLAVSLVAVREVYRTLGGTAFGALTFVLIANGLVTTFFVGGAGWTVVREIARESDGGAEPIERCATARRFASLYVLAAIGLAVVIEALRGPLVNAFLEELPPGTADTLIHALAAQTFLIVILAYARAILRGLERMLALSVFEVMRSVFYNVGVLWIASNGGSLETIAVWVPLAALPFVVLLLWRVASILGPRSVIPVLSLAPIRPAFNQVRPNVAASVWGLVQQFFDRMAVASLLSLEALGVFNLSFTSVSRLTMLRQAVSGALLPALTRIWSSDGDGFGRLFIQVQAAVLLFLLPAAGGAAILVPELIEVVLDADAARRALPATLFLALGSALASAVLAPTLVLIATGRSEALAAARRNAFLLSVVPSALAIYRFGLSGAGVAAFCNQAALLVLFARLPADQIERGWLGLSATLLAVGTLVFGAGSMVAANDGGRVVSLTVAAAASVVFLAFGYTILRTGFGISLRDLLGQASRRSRRRTLAVS